MNLSNEQLILLDALAYFSAFWIQLFLPVTIVFIFKQPVLPSCL